MTTVHFLVITFHQTAHFHTSIEQCYQADRARLSSVCMVFHHITVSSDFSLPSLFFCPFSLAVLGTKYSRKTNRTLRMHFVTKMRQANLAESDEEEATRQVTATATQPLRWGP